MIIATILVVAALIALSVVCWPWRKEEIERGQDACITYSYVGSFKADESKPYKRTYVLYRVINRYTKSVTLKKEYID